MTAIVAGCGGSSKQDVVAEVGGTPITREAVSHWMATTAGGDYYELSHKHTIPAGLVSDPPNYRHCVSQLEAAQASTSTATKKVTGAELLVKCEQLYQALKEQATTYLVRAQWTVESDRELGVTVNETQLLAFAKEFIAKQFPHAGELQQYLSTRRLSLADLYFVLKQDLLAQKTLKKIEAGGKVGSQELARYNDAGLKWNVKTTCKPGYVVEHCKQYKGGATYPNSPPASIMMERISTVVTGKCVNKPACGKE